ncbi:hypothetical protein An15g03520 [Aspergillus niger]|uniref:Uncharacterized protein n=2 Tax=Aspergillus niger TaxID=5061 RepID=A2R5D2_ASPNC|nr:hypothetical protein An15g03520 [Aspergillus niger]CAK42427.1 hypothetical protein An15g03520 [Aspergillus niger]
MAASWIIDLEGEAIGGSPGRCRMGTTGPAHLDRLLPTDISNSHASSTLRRSVKGAGALNELSLFKDWQCLYIAQSSIGSTESCGRNNVPDD